MKKLLWSVLACSLTLAAPVYANNNMTVEQKLDKMKVNLNLTQEQVNSVQPILVDYMNKKQALKTTGNGNENALNDQIEELNKEKMQKLSTVLTPDQLDKLEAMKDSNEWKDKSDNWKDKSTMKY